MKISRSIPAIVLIAVAALAPVARAGQAATARKSSRARTAPRRSLLEPAALTERSPATYRAKFTTAKGDFTIEVHRDWAPLGADRFYNLVKYHFYDGASFFRVLPGFVVQFGLSADPRVSRAWSAAAVRDDPVTQSNRRGMVTFATGGPNTRTTQVFVNLGDNVRLDSMGFSPFGQVTEGMDVIENLYSGYGEGAPNGNGPSQDRLTNEGKAYLEKEFPRLDGIKTAVILQPTAARPAAAHPPKEKP